MISTVLWAVLAFQAFKIEVPSGGVTLVFQEIIVVLFCWFMTFVGAVITGIGILDTLKTNKQEAQHG
ncbi:MAG: hypothetical protein NTU57_02615 [Candidatus Aenigmarchaeota archaeon]|nr:hypothetical protein [Candidatus Aenigmarchaeota archaeon]